MKIKKGQAMVEIAIILPIFLLLLCAVLDFGRILYASINLNMITQEAVRMGGLGKSDYEIMQYVNEQVKLPDKDTMIVNINPSDSSRDSGDYLTLKITYEVKYITPIIGNVINSPFQVVTQSTIRVE
ncbi:TadE/TadG family type IV pilus assembly protein [Clostridium grantii]|uniref:Flp pilus assembly protein TadG n=1 Tax=Clostridium grantii DSM 8605 TaxID=1121316 RepID=A0A1M5X6D7_9CLOT|nr:TadE/TadG family type IV pilus assembly protein [Clostridium grantii]SHH95359.1 Flp pilus assembly protein TadG [Clostridium grantii DSM 8605]